MASTPMHFRLELANGRAEEYRIRDGKIEARCLQNDPNDKDHDWSELTPEQVADHVNRNTAVASWLNRRMGWRPLLRACMTEQTLRYFNLLDNSDNRHAA